MHKGQFLSSEIGCLRPKRLSGSQSWAILPIDDEEGIRSKRNYVYESYNLIQTIDKAKSLAKLQLVNTNVFIMMMMMIIIICGIIMLAIFARCSLVVLKRC